MSERNMNVPKYAQIYDNRQNSEYALHNTKREVTL